MKDVLKRIRLIRNERGYSQEYMSERIGMEQAGYGLLETGKRRLTVEKLFQIAMVLDIDPAELISGEHKPTVVEESRPLYERTNDREKMLEREIELLRKAIEDKDKIIRLLEARIKLNK